MTEWKTYRLGEIGKIVTGKTPRTSQSEYFDGDIPFITPADLNTPFKRILSTQRTLTIEGLNSIKGCIIPANSIAVSCIGNLGYVGITNQICATNQQINTIIVNNQFDSHFIYYTIKHLWPYFKNLEGQSTTLSILNKTQFSQIEISLPSLEEQRRIAGILGAIDDKIENNRRINTNLELQAQALFDKLFFEDKDIKCNPLSDYANINPTRPLRQGAVARYIEMANLPTKGSFPSDWSYKSYGGGCKFVNGDTIMARITPCLENGKTAYVDFLEGQEVAFGSTEYIVISAKEEYCPALFYFLARNKEFVDYAVGHMNGSSGRQRVSGVDIANFPMPHISLEDSNKFAKMAMPNMDVIRNNSLENRRLATLRDTLLPKLMNGEIKTE